MFQFQLLEEFASGELRPGLYREGIAEKTYINNVVSAVWLNVLEWDICGFTAGVYIAAICCYMHACEHCNISNMHRASSTKEVGVPDFYAPRCVLVTLLIRLLTNTHRDGLELTLT